MKTADENRTENLESIDTVTLDDVTGGCAACGQACANGPAPAAAGGFNKAPLLAAAFAALSRR